MAEHTFVGSGSALALERTTTPAFPRAGAWAVHQGRVGILTAVRAHTAEFHVVDARGDTTLVIAAVPLREVRQATHDEIPAPRRPHEAVSRKLGYLPHPDGPVPPMVPPDPAITTAPAPSRRPFFAHVFSKLTRRPGA